MLSRPGSLPVGWVGGETQGRWHMSVSWRARSCGHRKQAVGRCCTHKEAQLLGNTPCAGHGDYPWHTSQHHRLMLDHLGPSVKH